MRPLDFDPQLWTAEELEIWRSLGYRCVICGKMGSTLHEIIPKSRTQHWQRPENRVVVCANCHFRIHHDGALVWKEALTSLRKVRLEHYVNCQQ